jgi:putative ABC transport system ATP-binding protein
MSSASDGADQLPAFGPDEPAAVGGDIVSEPVGVGAPEPADTRVAAVREVTKTYVAPTGQVVALHDVSLDVEGRGLHIVAGVAGSGVSTLLGLISCLDRPDTGQIWVAGIDTVAASRAARRELRRRAIGIVQPQPWANLLPDLPAGANIAWAAKRRTGAVLNTAGVDAHLEMVGMSGASRARVAGLSGGEQQRLALACALAGEPRLVVADDPTATLDRDEATRFVNALRDAADRGVCTLVGSSDPLMVGAADQLIQLAEGRIVP